MYGMWLEGPTVSSTRAERRHYTDGVLGMSQDGCEGFMTLHSSGFPEPVMGDLRYFSRLYGRNYSTLHKLWRKGLFVNVAYKQGDKVFFDAKDVDAWMRSQPLRVVHATLSRISF
jgi:hypothetical protein